MSTRNFIKGNAKYIYAIECYDNFELEDTEYNMLQELKKKGWDNGTDFNVFAEKSVSVSIGKFETEIMIKAFPRSGYYSKANFDWAVSIDGQEYAPDDFNEYEAADMLENSYEYCNNLGFCRIQAGNLEKRVKLAILSLSEELEEVYEKYTIPLVAVCIFSNGEAIYEKANSLRGMLNAV